MVSQKILPRVSKIMLTCVVALGLVVGLGVTGGVTSAYAATSTIKAQFAQLHVNDPILFGGYSTRSLMVSYTGQEYVTAGTVGYSADPMVNIPDEGSYEMETYSDDTSLAAAIWFGYGGAGFDDAKTTIWPATFYDGQAWTDDDYEIITEMVVASRYHHNSGIFPSLSDDAQAWYEENIDGYCVHETGTHPGHPEYQYGELINDQAPTYLIGKYGFGALTQSADDNVWPDSYYAVYKMDTGSGSQTILFGAYVEPLIEVTCTRLAGADRYETMSAVVEESFGNSDTVVVASGDNFPDALSASGLAGVCGCPVVLTSSEVLSDQASSEIGRLGANTVYIVGGPESVSWDIENTLTDQGLIVERIWAVDRYSTARLVYNFAIDDWGCSANDVKTAIVATGSTFADSLSASSYAWWADAPIFLTTSDYGLDIGTKMAIGEDNFDQIVIVGGENSVGSDDEEWLSSIAPTVRLAGDDRYETAIKFSLWASSRGMSFNNASVATGKNFPDALAGGALCGKCGSVILLADGSNTSAVDVVGAHRNVIDNLYILGGTNSVSDSVVSLFRSALTVL